jgi:hypothetical protein
MLKLLSQIFKLLKQIVLKQFLIKSMTWPHVSKTSKVLSLLVRICSLNSNLVLQICLKFWLMLKLLFQVSKLLKLTVLNQLLDLNNSNMVIWLLVLKILKES